LVRAVALALAAALALPAIADDAVVVPPPVPADAAVIESAQLDAAVVEQGAALELFGMSASASTALVFVVIAVSLVVLTANGDSQGVPP